MLYLYDTINLGHFDPSIKVNEIKTSRPAAKDITSPAGPRLEIPQLIKQVDPAQVLQLRLLPMWSYSDFTLRPSHVIKLFTFSLRLSIGT